MSQKRRRSNRNAGRDREAELQRVCELICQEERPTQKEIAAVLGLSEKDISQLVNLARRQGYVRTVFYPPERTAYRDRLQSHLKARGIKTVYVTGKGTVSVGHAAARYFEEAAENGQTIVLDGGKTVAAFVQSLANHAFERMRIVPLCADPASYDVSCYELMTRVAMKYPVMVECEKLPYWYGPHLAGIHNRVRKRSLRAHFALLGVGPLRTGFTALEFVKHLGLAPRKIASRYGKKVCCMTAYCAIGHDGHHVPIAEIDKRLPRSLEFAGLQQLAAGDCCKCILMAAGKRKADAVIAVLSARVCNVIIIDEELACALLERLDRLP